MDKYNYKNISLRNQTVEKINKLSKGNLSSAKTIEKLVEDKLKGNGVNSKGKHMEGTHIDQRQKA